MSEPSVDKKTFRETAVSLTHPNGFKNLEGLAPGLSEALQKLEEETPRLNLRLVRAAKNTAQIFTNIPVKLGAAVLDSAHDRGVEIRVSLPRNPKEKSQLNRRIVTFRWRLSKRYDHGNKVVSTSMEAQKVIAFVIDEMRGLIHRHGMADAPKVVPPQSQSGPQFP